MGTLVISPHGDDEVLGCYSYLKGADVFIISLNESNVLSCDRPDFDIRVKEAETAANFCGYNLIHMSNNFKVNEYYKELNSLLHAIEETINKYKPDTLLIPAPSYNQDHRSVYEACIIATRPHDKNHFVKKILIYEQPHTFFHPVELFQPNHFKEVDIRMKLDAYKIYSTQVRSYRSLSIVESLAFLRGKHVGKDFAEAFKIWRWV
jgi:LmbE family N-acetylglucosaminyl deacetylase